MVYFKENYQYTFPRFPGWSNIFQGVQHFPGGVGGGGPTFSRRGLNANLYRNH